MGESLRRVIEHARVNGGVVTRREALALGMSRSSIQRRVAEGVFIWLGAGVLALPGSADPFMLDLHSACRKLGAVVSHESAAYVHSLDRPLHIKPSISVPRNRTKEVVGVTVHQLGDLEESHVMIIDRLPVTTPERTIIDLAAVMPMGQLARILDHGLARGLVRLSELTTLFGELGRRGKPGTASMRKLLEVRGGGFVAPESELERRLLLLIEDAALPPPVRQFKAPWLSFVNGRVDLAYPDHRLIVEADGRRWHTLAEAFETDRVRDNEAQLAGWRVLRFTWDEMRQNPLRVVATIRRALELEPI